MKAFKYFDLENKGRVCIKAFGKALDKFGCVFKPAEIRALFQKYDKDHSGTLNCEEFASVFALMGAGTNPNIHPTF